MPTRQFTEPNIERLLAAFQQQKYDRVPNFEILIDSAMVQFIIGEVIIDREYIKNEEKNSICNSWALEPADAIELAKRTYQDAIIVPLSWGLAERGSICTWEDIEKIGPPPDLNQCREKLKRYLDAVQNTNIGVGVCISAPFFHVYLAIGPVPVQSFMLKLYDDLSFIETLMDINLKYHMKVIEAIMDLPISFIYMDDDVAMNSGLIIRPEIMDQIWVPRAQRLVKLAKEVGVPIEWHTCGKLDYVLPILVRWGVDAVHPIQSNCNDIYDIKKHWGEQICLVGNMDIQGVLAFGSPQEVITDTKKHIDRLAYNGGYVVASSHSIVDAIPPANYFAMIETAQTYGRFKH